VVTCVLAIVVESRYPTRQELTALVTLTLGVMLAVWQGTVSGKPYAIAFCLVGTVCNGAMMTFSGKLLRCGRAGRQRGWSLLDATSHLLLELAVFPLLTILQYPISQQTTCHAMPCSEKLNVVRLTFYTAPVSLLCLAPFFWVYEVRWV
jgi:hypothetical protein